MKNFVPAEEVQNKGTSIDTIADNGWLLHNSPCHTCDV